MHGAFLGFCPLASTLYGTVLTRNTSNVPTDAAAAPGFRVYGPGGTTVMPNGTGSCSLKDSGTITAASNATPIVVTIANHGFTTGSRVTVSGVLGNTAANGSFTITRVDGNTFSLDSSVGNGAWTSGGTAHISGLYGFSLSVAGGDGYAAGQCYTIIVSFTVGSTAMAELYTFVAS